MKNESSNAYHWNVMADVKIFCRQTEKQQKRNRQPGQKLYAFPPASIGREEISGA